MTTSSREIKQIPVGMRPGLRTLNSCVLKVSMSEAVPDSFRPKLRELSHVYTPPALRRQRYMTMLLNLVCQEADANKITLLLTAAPPADDVALTAEQLASWYSRFGFRRLETTDQGILMARQVRVKSRVLQATMNDILGTVRNG